MSVERDRARNAARYRKANPEPKGRAAIRTADPIMRELFVIAYRKGISSKEIAERIGQSPQTLTGWKKGNHNADAIDAHLFAKAIGCTIVIQEASDE